MQQSAMDTRTGSYPNKPLYSIVFHQIKLYIRLNPFIFTGTIDMDLITTGVSASERMRRESLIQDTRNMIMEKMQIGGRSMRLLEVLPFFLKPFSIDYVQFETMI